MQYILLFIDATYFSQQIQMGNPIIEFIRNNITNIQQELAQKIQAGNFHYETFGKDVEKPITEIIIQKLTAANLVEKKDCHPSMTKNDFPDLRITLSPEFELAIEIKSGNHSQLRDGTWKNVKNSENDLWTIGEWPKKIGKFWGDNIYYLFVEYNFNGSTLEIIDIKIEHFYCFVGLGESWMLKYREKDGNLRPKDFNALPLIQSLSEFEKLLWETKIYRSERIITHHFEDLPNDQQKEMFEKLRAFMEEEE